MFAGRHDPRQTYASVMGDGSAAADADAEFDAEIDETVPHVAGTGVDLIAGLARAAAHRCVHRYVHLGGFGGCDHVRLVPVVTYVCALL